MLSLRKEPWRRFTRKEKGKKNMPEYDTDRDESDRSESVSRKNEEGPLETESESAKRALKSTKEKLC